MKSSASYTLGHIKLWAVLAILCGCAGCRQDSRIQKQWLGRTVVISPELTRIVNDSIPLDKKLKIVFYADSTSCAPCQLQLPYWENLIEKYQDDVSFFFIVPPKNKMELIAHCRQIGFDYPLLLDTRHRMAAENMFPKEAGSRCFLLDESDRVIAVGHPLYNKRALQQYQTLIAERSIKPDDNEDRPRPGMDRTETLSVLPSAFDWGEMLLNDVRSAELKAVNLTDRSIMLIRAETSCECTVVTWPDTPIIPHDTTTLYIRYEANYTGDYVNLIRLFEKDNDTPIADFQFSVKVIARP